MQVAIVIRDQWLVKHFREEQFGFEKDKHVAITVFAGARGGVFLGCTPESVVRQMLMRRVF